jgi:simple sugar transport system substrate-binding protein
MPDPDALGASVQAARNANLPVVTINSGYEAAERLNVLAHVGQTEYEAGYQGGKRMAEAGVKNALCVNMEVGNAALDLRCDGFDDAMREAGAATRVLAVEIGDPTESQQRIEAAISSDPTIDGLLSLGPTSALPALRALEAQGLLGERTFATFDVSPEILDAIEQGHIVFAIDQQPYLQGYMPVVLIALYLRNGNVPGNPIFPTGPGFVTTENVGLLKELTSAGTR